MSETELSDIAPSRRNEIRAEAAEWFARAHSDDWSGADQEKLDAWLRRSLSHEAAYWRLEGAWMEAARLTVLRASAETRNPAAARHVIPAPIKILVVAVFVAVIGVAGYSYLSGPLAERITTPVGGQRTLVLSDGSQIELDTNTVVRVAMNADKRTVWLDRGEVYFRINHDAKRPFAVTVGDHRIVDLGTQFLVKQSADNVEVSLLEGRARLEAGGGLFPTRSIELSPGDVATATVDSMSVTKKPTKALANELGWRRGVLVFEGTSLADAAAEMNRYNVQQIVIADTSIARHAIDGTFPVHAVSQFTEMAQAIFGFRVEKQGNRTLISR
jgi:transmembrane sensor